MKRATPIGMTEEGERTMENRCEEMREQVKAYHKEHPEVWRLFTMFTFQMIDSGKKNYSVSSIWERIRWHKDAGSDGETQFKINNNYRAFYARAFMEKYPLHKGFFRTRKQKSEDQAATNMRELTPDYYRESA